MKVDDAVAHLTKLGLDQDEALVFVHLSTLGRPAKVSEVAAAGLPRPRVYRIANRLMQRNFVFSTFTSPVRFQSIGVEELLRQLEGLEAEKAVERQRARQELAATLSALVPVGKQVGKNLFRIHQGRAEIVRNVDRLVRDAKRRLDAITTFPGAVSIAESSGVLGAMERRAKQGLAERLIVRHAPDARASFEWMKDSPHAELRLLDGEDHVRFLIADGEQMVLWVVHDPSRGLGAAGEPAGSPRRPGGLASWSAPEDVALWSEARDFVRTMQFLFEVLWQQAAKGPVEAQATECERR